MSTNSGDGFTDAELEEALTESAAREASELEVSHAENEALQLRWRGRILTTLCPAGREPYDYLLVDFSGAGGMDEGPSIRVVAQVAERLDLSVLELDSRLEYTPQQWAAARGKHHAPDPARAVESRHLELDGEIEFYERLGIPYSAEESETLRDAVGRPNDADIVAAARAIRDRKKREPKPADADRDLAPAPPAPRWWPFKKKTP